MCRSERVYFQQNKKKARAKGKENVTLEQMSKPMIFFSFLLQPMNSFFFFERAWGNTIHKEQVEGVMRD